MIIMISSIYLSVFSQLFPLFPPLDDEILAIDEGKSLEELKINLEKQTTNKIYYKSIKKIKTNCNRKEIEKTFHIKNP